MHERNVFMSNTGLQFSLVKSEKFRLLSNTPVWFKTYLKNKICNVRLQENLIKF